MVVQNDRLMRLGMARGALKRAGIRSPEEYRRATADQLRELGPHAPLLRRLLRTAGPNVLAGLFDPPEWHVALLLTHPQDRLLVVEGREPIVYRADHPEAERRAWATIGVAR